MKTIPDQFKDYLIKWPLDSKNEQKYFFDGTHRTCLPEATLERITPLREAAGITRVADITYIDYVGIPTYSAIRPQSEFDEEHISINNGKGLTKLQAKISALMEAFEGFSGEPHDRPTILARFSEISDDIKPLNPKNLILSTDDTYDLDQKLEWVLGTEIITGTPRFIPAQAIFYPWCSKKGGYLFKNLSNTNGLASGNTIGEAIAHALAEVIERDSESIAELAQNAVSVDLSTIRSPFILDLFKKINTAGLTVSIKDITSDIGIASFFAVTDEPNTENPILLCRGVGTHVNSEIALIRAVTEVAQSRCGIISGAREDLDCELYKKSINYHALKKRMGYWYNTTPHLRDFSSIKSYSTETFTEDIQIMIKNLCRANINEIVVVNLTHSKIGIPVVKVVVPGLEQTVVCRSRQGKRAVLARNGYGAISGGYYG